MSYQLPAYGIRFRGNLGDRAGPLNRDASTSQGGDIENRTRLHRTAFILICVTTPPVLWTRLVLRVAESLPPFALREPNFTYAGRSLPPNSLVSFHCNIYAIP